MAIYNLGQIEQPKEQINPYMAYLLQAGLQGQQIEGQKEVAGINELGATQRRTAELQAKYDATEKKAVTNTMQFLVDKYTKGNDTSALEAVLESEKGKVVMKQFLKHNPELSKITNPLDRLPIPSWDAASKMFDEQIANAKNKVALQGLESLDSNERAILELDKNGLANETRDAMRDLIRSDPMGFTDMMINDPDNFQKALMNFISIKRKIDADSAPSKSMPVPSFAPGINPEMAYAAGNVLGGGSQFSAPLAGATSYQNMPVPTASKNRWSVTTKK